MKKRQGGFTIIELVVVITIVAILAAIAMPKYIALQQQARVAKMQMYYGTMRSAAAMAKAGCIADMATSGTPLCTATGGAVLMEGTSIAMVNQYPAANANAILAASQINPATDGLTVATGAGSLTMTLNMGTTPANCSIGYTEAASGNSPSVSLTTSGC